MATTLSSHHSRLGFLQWRQPKDTDPKPKPVFIPTQHRLPASVMIQVPRVLSAPFILTPTPSMLPAPFILTPAPRILPASAVIPAPRALPTPVVQNVSIVVIQDYYIKGSKSPIKTILLGLRSDKKYVVFGGGIDQGESISKAASRELQEESFGTIYLSESIINTCPTHTRRSHAAKLVTITGKYSIRGFISNKHKYRAAAPACFREIHDLVRVPLDTILSGMASGQITSDLKSCVVDTIDGQNIKIDKWAMDTIYRCLVNNFHNIASSIHLRKSVYKGSKHWLHGAIEYVK